MARRQVEQGRKNKRFCGLIPLSFGRLKARRLIERRATFCGAVGPERTEFLGCRPGEHFASLFRNAAQIVRRETIFNAILKSPGNWMPAAGRGQGIRGGGIGRNCVQLRVRTPVAAEPWARAVGMAFASAHPWHSILDSASRPSHIGAAPSRSTDERAWRMQLELRGTTPFGRIS